MHTDRIKRAFESLVRHLTSRLDWLALYPASVVVQHADGTLDLQPDDARLPGVTGVPMRLGLPGVTVRVSAGARVLLGFEGGDPARPIATLWQPDAIEEIAFANGTKRVARVGDKTAGHKHTVSFSLSAPNGPVTGSITIADATDEIAEGAEKVKA